MTNLKKISRIAIMTLFNNLKYLILLYSNYNHISLTYGPHMELIKHIKTYSSSLLKHLINRNNNPNKFKHKSKKHI
jgi:hypothetical protein